MINTSIIVVLKIKVGLIFTGLHDVEYNPLVSFARTGQCQVILGHPNEGIGLGEIETTWVSVGNGDVPKRLGFSVAGLVGESKAFLNKD